MGREAKCKHMRRSLRLAAQGKLITAMEAAFRYKVWKVLTRK